MQYIHIVMHIYVYIYKLMNAWYHNIFSTNVSGVSIKQKYSV